MSTDGADEVKARAPAAPEANAKTMYIRPTLVRDDISRKDGSTGKKMPIVRDRKTAMKMPMTIVLSELLAMTRSPRVGSQRKGDIWGQHGSYNHGPDNHCDIVVEDTNCCHN